MRAITRAARPKRGSKTSMRRNFKKFDSVWYNEDALFIPFPVVSTFKDINDVCWAKTAEDT